MANQFVLHVGAAEDAYASWPSPHVIVSDGPYGMRGYPGDLHHPGSLARWYAPHAKTWAQRSGFSTSLWFWNTELGWAESHPALAQAGWKYVQCNIWDKGAAHIAGRVNTGACRRFPVTTEVCVLYELDPAPCQRWVLSEWRRAGLTLGQANLACGVKEAASRKYLTQDAQWYLPEDKLNKLSRYANRHGESCGRPYFDRQTDPRRGELLRRTFKAPFGVSNVWRIPALRGAERLRNKAGEVMHPNQKPISLMKQILRASSRPGDVVWEPFGGTCSGAAAAIALGRQAFAAEVRPELAVAARGRMTTARGGGFEREVFG